jgi:hypothetical protein
MSLPRILDDIQKSGVLEPDAEFISLAANAPRLLVSLIAECKAQELAAAQARADLALLNLALAEWANERGQGALFFQEIQLCLDICRDRHNSQPNRDN